MVPFPPLAMRRAAIFDKVSCPARRLPDAKSTMSVSGGAASSFGLREQRQFPIQTVRAEIPVAFHHIAWYNSNMNTKCPICQKPARRTYCSQLCSAIARRINKERACRCCGSLFYARVREVKKGYGIYCSDKCRRQYQTEHSPIYARRQGKYVHRMVAAKKLGRELLPGEEVHHLDGNKRNNIPENLIVIPSHTEHMKLEASLGRIGNSHEQAVAYGKLSGIARRNKSIRHRKAPQSCAK